MRASLPACLLLSLLLAACASTKDAPANKNISQNGPLKVHPGLLGQPVPRELQPAAGTQLTPPPTAPSAPAASPAPAPAPAPAAAPPAGTAPASPPADTTIRMDKTGIRTQRSVYFDFDSALVKADFNPALQAHARYLADNPKAKVRIEGNADERGDAAYNGRLGMKRAENVQLAMIQYGAPGNQVRVRSLGESRPKLKGHDQESWAENRRADVVYEKEN